MPNVDLMTTAQVAEVIGKHPRTVVRMVQRGQIVPAHRGAGSRGPLLFAAEDVQALAASDD